MTESLKEWQRVSDLVEEYAKAAHTNSLGAYEACERVYRIAQRHIKRLEKEAQS